MPISTLQSGSFPNNVAIDTDTLVVDGANNRVGINQATPAHPVHVGTDDLIVDASGNLLVGKTASNVAAEGAEIRPSGFTGLTVDGGAGLTIRRLTSDGELQSFFKDTTKVGSIESRGGVALTINSQGGNGRLSQSGTAYYEWNTTRLSPVTDTVGDLGRSSQRWKDLYLSGGVYLGGTGAANKLDDYEEGTFTAFIYGTTSGTGVKANTTGDYIKVGNHCTISAYFSNANLSSMSGSLKVGGLPFTSTSSAPALYTGSLILYGFSFSGFATPYISAGQTSLDILDSINNGSWQAVAVPAAAGKYMIIGCTYRTA